MRRFRSSPSTSQDSRDGKGRGAGRQEPADAERTAVAATQCALTLVLGRRGRDPPGAWSYRPLCSRSNRRRSEDAFMTRRVQRPAATGRSRRQESRVILRLEALEDRTLLSAAIPLAPGSYDPTQVLVQFRPAALVSGTPALTVPGATLGPQLSSVPGLYDVQLKRPVRSRRLGDLPGRPAGAVRRAGLLCPGDRHAQRPAVRQRVGPAEHRPGRRHGRRGRPGDPGLDGQSPAARASPSPRSTPASITITRTFTRTSGSTRRRSPTPGTRSPAHPARPTTARLQVADPRRRRPASSPSPTSTTP